MSIERILTFTLLNRVLLPHSLIFALIYVSCDGLVEAARYNRRYPQTHLVFPIYAFWASTITFRHNCRCELLG